MTTHHATDASNTACHSCYVPENHAIVHCDAANPENRHGFCQKCFNMALEKQSASANMQQKCWSAECNHLIDQHKLPPFLMYKAARMAAVARARTDGQHCTLCWNTQCPYYERSSNQPHGFMICPTELHSNAPWTCYACGDQAIELKGQKSCLNSNCSAHSGLDPATRAECNRISKQTPTERVEEQMHKAAFIYCKNRGCRNHTPLQKADHREQTGPFDMTDGQGCNTARCPVCCLDWCFVCNQLCGTGVHTWSTTPESQRRIIDQHLKREVCQRLARESSLNIRELKAWLVRDMMAAHYKDQNLLNVKIDANFGCNLARVQNLHHNYGLLAPLMYTGLGEAIVEVPEHNAASQDMSANSKPTQPIETINHRRAFLDRIREFAGFGIAGVGFTGKLQSRISRPANMPASAVCTNKRVFSYDIRRRVWYTENAVHLVTDKGETYTIQH